MEFDERVRALGGQIVPGQALSLLLNRDSGFWADEDARLLLPRGGIQAKSVWEAEVGICTAELAIAETGSLLLSAAKGRWRLTSLAPPVNVILVQDSAIVGTLEEAFARLPLATSVVVTGTSRTADIEGVLIRGVHGPRELYVVRM
jgi:L-lactate dehydrogenase complex protein LldG